MSLDKPQDPIGVDKLVRDIQKANADALLNPKIDLSADKESQIDLELPARIARTVRESERLRDVLGELPDRHERKGNSSVEL